MSANRPHLQGSGDAKNPFKNPVPEGAARCGPRTGRAATNCGPSSCRRQASQDKSSPRELAPDPEPFGGAPAMLKDLKDKVFPGREIKAVVVQDGKKTVAVV